MSEQRMVRQTSVIPHIMRSETEEEEYLQNMKEKYAKGPAKSAYGVTQK